MHTDDAATLLWQVRDEISGEGAGGNRHAEAIVGLDQGLVVYHAVESGGWGYEPVPCAVDARKLVKSMCDESGDCFAASYESGKWALWRDDEDDTMLYVAKRALNSISLCKTTQSQAVMVVGENKESKDIPTAQLVLIDVAQTYATGSLHVVSSTSCTFPLQLWGCVSYVLLMEDQSGENVFVVEMDDGGHSWVCSVKNGVTETLIKVTWRHFSGRELEHRVAHQLSRSLFSVYTPRNEELVVIDCNDTSTAKRVIPNVSNNGHISGAGFIFVVAGGCGPEENCSLQVIEALSGVTVACINFPPQCGYKLGSFFHNTSYYL
ncbi:hypothetical protein Pelo_17390 [Pelomyxa schiedti]|nr:hypothetical protein Pelo_17390 [Pelomyxa schiedti]